MLPAAVFIPLTAKVIEYETQPHMEAAPRRAFLLRCPKGLLSKNILSRPHVTKI